MREADGLYYAPGVSYADLSAKDVVPLFRARLRGFFLEPARGLVDRGEDFAALCVLLNLFEALAEAHAVANATGVDEPLPRLKALLHEYRVENADAREKFVDLCRNGLIHHGRLNRGSELDRAQQPSLRLLPGFAVAVNVVALMSDAERVIESVLDTLTSGGMPMQRWRAHFHRVFRRELGQ
jgi:hypothetical protein